MITHVINGHAVDAPSGPDEFNEVRIVLVQSGATISQDGGMDGDEVEVTVHLSPEQAVQLISILSAALSADKTRFVA